MPSTRDHIQAIKRQYSIIGDSPQLTAAIERALRVAPTDFSVIVIGESGTGKEFFPKIIHDNSPRKHKKYIAVNCGAIPDGTIDSELFGHKKGAYTDATSDRKGYFEEADGGTIFLDEVAEMPMSTQARLLRVLESGEFIRMGENTPRKTNIRVVAATNKDVEQAIKEGRFREDLYYRLSTVTITVPPLRERGRDVLLLMRKFLHEFEEDTHSQAVSFTDDARQRLADYHWPGNVRQLKNVAYQLGLFESGNTVDTATLNHYLPNDGKPQLPAIMANSQFDYTKERELIFMLIKQMQHEIDTLKDTVTDGTQHATIHVGANVDELQREVHQLTASHLTEDIEPDDSTIVPAIARLHGGNHLTNPHGNVHEVHAMEVEPLHEPHREHQHIKTLDETERDTIIEALHRNNGRRKRTAEELKISERTLYRKIKEYGLERQ